MRILHTESSSGWGGQEMRILREAEGMRERGHDVILAVVIGGALVSKARSRGFTVYEIPLFKGTFFQAMYHLVKIIIAEKIELVNTHSSLDAWMGGISARFTGRKVIRTRHLSTASRKGLNSFLLYRVLSDFVVTTSSCVLGMIQSQARLPSSRLRCIATGVNPTLISATAEEVTHFRESLGVTESDVLIGTACFVRSWKGIVDLLKAAQLLKEEKHIKWIVVGGGYYKDYQAKVAEMGLEKTVIFTGHLEAPYAAIAAMDVFTLLSTAHEGISQASLQAAYLERPLITTPIGGLPEVCIEGKTGIVVPPFSPEKIAEAVLQLSRNPALRSELGRNAKRLVEEKFTLKHTLDQMAEVYQQV